MNFLRTASLGSNFTGSYKKCVIPDSTSRLKVFSHNLS